MPARGDPLAWLLLGRPGWRGAVGLCPAGAGRRTADSPAERRAAIEAVSTWEARGRIALKTPGASGQGNFTWVQDGRPDRAPGRGPLRCRRLRESAGSPARLTVLSGRGEVAADYTGADAAQRFLEEQLGWSLPVANARYWLLGLAGPGTRPSRPSMKRAAGGPGPGRLGRELRRVPAAGPGPCRASWSCRAAPAGASGSSSTRNGSSGFLTGR